MSQVDEEAQAYQEDEDVQVLCCCYFDRKPGLKLITALWALWSIILLTSMTLGIISKSNASYLDLAIVLADIYAFCILISALSKLDSNSEVEDEALK
jgi:hypothetical protein